MAKAFLHLGHAEEHTKILEGPDDNVRVLISKRPDGAYTYQIQWRSEDDITTGEDGWGQPGPACGLYDSADAAETEARQRVLWLKRMFH